jgi:diguanylate cyclase (GGDEF)-like protein
MNAAGLQRRLLAELFPPVMPSTELSPELRCQLIGSLYEQQRTSIEGSLVLVIVAMTCWWQIRTLWWPLWAGTALLVMALRLISGVFYRRYATAGNQEDWARWFVWGALATALVWGAGCLAVILYVDDPLLVFFVVLAEMSWVSAAAIRHQISPAAARCQVVGPLLPTAIGFLINHALLYRVSGVLLLIQIGGHIGIAAFLREQTRGLFSAWQKKQAELYDQLNSTCAELEQANARLRNLSATDGLTGIGNRRALDAELQIEWERAAGNREALSLLMLDVDWFKAYNDLYGHLAGDNCLREIAHTLESELRRPPDFAARFGGEEFMAVLPGTDLRGAMEAAERIRERMLELKIAHTASAFGCVTVSVGVATVMAPQQGIDPQGLIASADEALYCAKQAGRNRVWSLAVPPSRGELTGEG